jgi:hypothetical protein
LKPDSAHYKVKEINHVTLAKVASFAKNWKKMLLLKASAAAFYKKRLTVLLK